MAENSPPTAEAPALVVKNVSHSFGDNRALSDVSLEIPRGRFVMLLGLNGAGKSTLFALITRLYDNVTGEIRIFGHDIRRRAMAALQRLGVVFQSRTLDLDLTLSMAAQAPQQVEQPRPAGLHVPLGSRLDEAERSLIEVTLEYCEGDKRRAAAVLGCSLKTLYNKLNSYARTGAPDRSRITASSLTSTPYSGASASM